jgi:hypothetical protein
MEKSLKTIEQMQVILYDDELTAIRTDDGNQFGTQGSARQSQVRRIKQHTILAEGYAGGTILIPPGPIGGDGRPRTGDLYLQVISYCLLASLKGNRASNKLAQRDNQEGKDISGPPGAVGIPAPEAIL